MRRISWDDLKKKRARGAAIARKLPPAPPRRRPRNAEEARLLARAERWRKARGYASRLA